MWDGWMASPTQWTRICAKFWRWWRTGEPGVLQSTGSQRVRHNWATEKQLFSHLSHYTAEFTINSDFSVPSLNIHQVLQTKPVHSLSTSPVGPCVESLLSPASWPQNITSVDADMGKLNVTKSKDWSQVTRATVSWGRCHSISSDTDSRLHKSRKQTLWLALEGSEGTFISCHPSF